MPRKIGRGPRHDVVGPVRYRDSGSAESLPHAGLSRAACTRLPACHTATGASQAGWGRAAEAEAASSHLRAASSLRAKCDLPFIGAEGDLDRWLAALRAAASEELKKGNRISLPFGISLRIG